MARPAGICFELSTQVGKKTLQVCCNVLQCLAVSCSVWQCASVYCEMTLEVGSTVYIHMYTYVRHDSFVCEDVVYLAPVPCKWFLRATFSPLRLMPAGSALKGESAQGRTPERGKASKGESEPGKERAGLSGRQGRRLRQVGRE